MKTTGSVISTCVWVCLLLSSCKKETGTPAPADVNPPPPATTITPLAFQSASIRSDISANSAKITSTITASGSSAITEHGHYFSKTNKDPGASDEKTKLGTKTGPFPAQFSSQLTNLEESVTYYVKPYATNQEATTTGEILTFTTNGFGAWNKIISYSETGEGVPADYDGD
jgi:hypothetical protein